ncbi:MAG TPA: hypothetical protein VF058_00830 [Actinomycetota bacterium]
MRRVIVILALLAAACSGEAPAEPAPEATASGVPYPYPFTTPTPPPEVTPLDGVWIREVPDELAGPVGKCRRCPPYRLELGDTNTLTIVRGTFEIEHTLHGWTNAGHVFVEADTATLINDPNCTSAEGVYRWTIEGDELTFELVEDACAFGDLRPRYFTSTSWTRAG